MKFIAANAEEAAAAAGKQKAHMAQTADGSAVRSKYGSSHGSGSVQHRNFLSTTHRL